MAAEQMALDLLSNCCANRKEAAEMLRSQAAEINSLKENAERFCWLRDNPNYEIKRRRNRVAVVPTMTSYEYETFKTLEEAVDAAMYAKRR